MPNRILTESLPKRNAESEKNESLMKRKGGTPQCFPLRNCGGFAEKKKSTLQISADFRPPIMLCAIAWDLRREKIGFIDFY